MKIFYGKIYHRVMRLSHTVATRGDSTVAQHAKTVQDTLKGNYIQLQYYLPPSHRALLRARNSKGLGARDELTIAVNDSKIVMQDAARGPPHERSPVFSDIAAALNLWANSHHQAVRSVQQNQVPEEITNIIFKVHDQYQDWELVLGYCEEAISKVTYDIDDK